MSVPIELLLQTFDLYDRNRVGKIPVTSISNILRSCGMFCTKTEMETILSENFSSSDTVNKAEFTSFIKKSSKEMEKEKKKGLKAEDFRSEEELAVAFQAFDAREAGGLTADEIMVILTRMSETITLDEFHEVMLGLEINKNGLVEFQRIAAHMLRPAKEYKLTAKQTLSELSK